MPDAKPFMPDLFGRFTIAGEPALTEFQIMQGGNWVPSVKVHSHDGQNSVDFDVNLSVLFPKNNLSRKLQIDVYTLNGFSHSISDEGKARAAKNTVISVADYGTMVATPHFSFPLDPQEHLTATLLGLDVFFLTKPEKTSDWTYEPFFRTVAPLEWSDNSAGA